MKRRTTALACVVITSALAPRVAFAQAEPAPAPPPEAAPAPEPTNAPAPEAPPAPERAPSPSRTPKDDDRAPRSRGLVTRIEVGYAWRRLFDLNIGAIEGGLGLGADTRRGLGVFGRATYSRGQTTYGLDVEVVRLEAGFEGIVLDDRLRIGGSAGAGGIVVERATGAKPLFKIMFGVGVHATVDVIQTDHTAIYLGAYGAADAPWFFRATLFSGGLRGGVRF